MGGVISVIMPCFNAASYVEESVRCVMGQSYPNVELIVVDDGSTDGSVEIVQRLAEAFPGRIQRLSQDHAGPYPARNLGLQSARGEWVAFLDADDWWAPDCLEKLHRAMKESGADLAYSGWQNVFENGLDRPSYVPPDYLREDLFARLLKGCPWPIHAALVKREILDGVGGFSTDCFSSMDYDLWLRIAAFTQNWIRVPEVLAFYRWHDKGQISAVKWRQILEAVQVRRKFVAEYPQRCAHLSPETLRRLVTGPILKSAYDALWKRDLTSSQKLFRHALKTGGWRLADLKHLIPSLLPPPAYRQLIQWMDSR
ncbi:MAG: glycosyltransferase [Methylohalobius sp. ZOD2]